MRETFNAIFTRDFVAVSLINLIMMSAYYMLMVTITSYSLTELNASHSIAGLIAGSMVLGLLVGRFVSGKLISILNFKTLLFFGIGEYLVFMGCYFLAETPEQLLVVRFLSGFGVGLVSTVTGTVVAHILPQNLMGTGISYYSLSTILATALGPFMGLLMMQSASFQSLFVFSMVSGVLSGLVVFALRITRQPEAEKGAEKMEETDHQRHGAGGESRQTASVQGQSAEMLAYEKEHAVLEGKILSKVPAPGESGPTDPETLVLGRGTRESAGEAGTPEIEPIKNRKKDSRKKFAISMEDFIDYRTIPISMVVLLCGFGYSSIQAFISSYAQELDLMEAAGMFFIVYAAVILISRPLTGKIIDKKGPNTVVYPSLILFSAGLLLLSYVNSWWAFLLAGALVGLGFGNFQSTAQAIAIKMVPEHRFGHATSTFFIFLDVSVGVGPFLLGFIVAHMSYSGLYQSMSVLALLCVGVYSVLQAHRPPYEEARVKDASVGKTAEPSNGSILPELSDSPGAPSVSGTSSAPRNVSGTSAKSGSGGKTGAPGGAKKSSVSGASGALPSLRGSHAHAKQGDAKTPR